MALAGSQATLPTWIAIVGVALIAVSVVANWQSVARRSTFYGLNALLMSLAMVAIMAVIYLIAANRDQSWDLTATGKYSLDPQTESILDNLDQPVKLLVFAGPEARASRNFAQAKDLLDEYTKRSDQVTYEILDPSEDYNTAIEYAELMNSFGEPTLVAQIEMEVENEAGEMETRKFKEKAAQMTQEDISNAIKKVTHREAVKAYFLVGHYERELDNQNSPTGLALLNSFLKKDNIDAAPLRIGAAGEIPVDADIIALAGPQEDLSETELTALEGFVLSGGGLFVGLDPGDFPATTLKMRQFGFEVGEDKLVEMQVGAGSLDELLRGIMRATPTDQVHIEKFDEAHEITKDMGTATVRLIGARSIGKLPQPPEGYTVADLAETAGGRVGEVNIPNTWADKEPEQLDLKGGTPVDQLFDPEKDAEGPISVMKAVEVDLETAPNGKPDPAKPGAKGKIVLVGDSDFLTNGGMQVRGGVSRGHLDLAMNVFNWLAGQVDLISIRQDAVENTSVTLNPDQEKMLKNYFVWVLPVLIALLGAAIVFYRRWRYV
jgi:hypothetical protein